MTQLLSQGAIPGSVRTINLAGEALTAELVDRIYEQTEILQVFDLYGPSEDTTYSTFARREKAARATLGRPISNTAVYLLDSQYQLVPVGMAGELCIGGGGLARGYYGRPELTAERFVPNPFAKERGERFYKTGDLARYFPDGNIEFLGRIDQQVKLNGFRIEPGEIESVLQRHPLVYAAAVTVRDDGSQSKRLVAYVAMKTAMSDSEWRDYLRTYLPEFMIPSFFVMLDGMPLMPNGKIDRKALPIPEPAGPTVGEEVAAITPAEKALTAIWARVLKCERVGIHDNFFDLGGDSILSIQIVAQANDAGLKLTTRQVFEHQTIAKLAQAAGQEKFTLAEQGPVSGPVEWTPIQRWFFEQSLDRPHHFNQSILLEVKLGLKAESVRQVVQELAKHHDSLRLRFEQSSEGWRQTNAGIETHRIFSRVDFAELPEEQQKARIASEAASVQSSLDLKEGPLMRVVWFDLGNQRSARLLIVIHHLVVDGVSWRILLDDLQRGCAQVLAGKKIGFGRKTSSFQQWTARLRDYERSDAVQKDSGLLVDLGSGPNQMVADGGNRKEPGGFGTHGFGLIECHRNRGAPAGRSPEIPDSYQRGVPDRVGASFC